MGYKSFVSAINTQVGGQLSKFLATATQPQPFSVIPGSSHPDPGDMSRRKTEPLLLQTKNRRSQPEITPLSPSSSSMGLSSSKTSPFVSGSSGSNKNVYGPSPRRSSVTPLTSPARRESDVSSPTEVSSLSPELNIRGSKSLQEVHGAEVDTKSNNRHSSSPGDEAVVENESSCSIS
jgi:hypothetical protein